MGRLKILFLVLIFYPTSGISIENSVFEDGKFISNQIEQEREK